MKTDLGRLPRRIRKLVYDSHGKTLDMDDQEWEVIIPFDVSEASLIPHAAYITLGNDFTSELTTEGLLKLKRESE